LFCSSLTLSLVKDVLLLAQKAPKKQKLVSVATGIGEVGMLLSPEPGRGASGEGAKKPKRRMSIRWGATTARRKSD
jgi:hypothetical protein